MGRRVGGIGELSRRLQLRIRQVIDLLHIGDDGVDQLRRGLRPVELVDDHIAGEITQRGDAAVASIGGEVADAPQARDVDVAMQIVGGLGVEQGIDHRQPARPVGKPGNEHELIDVALVMAGLAADPRPARRIAEDQRRGEGHIAQRDEIALPPAIGLVMQNFAGQPDSFFAQHARRRQDRWIAAQRRQGDARGENRATDQKRAKA